MYPRNEVWSSDITYIRTPSVMYMAAYWLAAILSYKLSNSMDASLVTSILEDALKHIYSTNDIQ